MSLGKLIKSLAPIAISAFAGPAIGQGIGQLFGTQTALNPFLTRALTGAATSKLMGGRNKDAVRNALLAGVGGMAIDNFTGQQTPVDRTAVRTPTSGEKLPFAMTRSEQVVDSGASGIKKAPIENVSQQIQGVAPRTFSGELLQAAGVSDDNLLARLLNTRVGEGLTAGLIAQLLAGDDDEDEFKGNNKESEKDSCEDEEDKKHSYDTDRIPEGLTPPSDAVIISEEEDRYGNTIKLKRKKLNQECDPKRQKI